MSTLLDLLRSLVRAPREAGAAPVRKAPPSALRRLHFMDERPPDAAASLAAGDRAACD